MAQQFWLGEFFIDLSRNQIIQNQQPQTIAPKALAVLAYLAKNQGNVVSQEELLEQVWPKTVVSPNTLQRSIAQLRKALGDDGKAQNYIKTHAKKGYSLECTVQWSVASPHHTALEKSSSNESSIVQLGDKPQVDYVENASAQTESEIKQHNKTRTVTAKDANTGLKWVVALLIVFAVFLSSRQYWQNDIPQTLTVSKIQALTATDGKELASIYSPDGSYVIFHRFSEQECVNDIWAKHLETQEEYRLTDKIDAYGKHSFSPDGKKLVFIRTLDCEKPVTQKQCYQLLSLDFIKALQSPQSPHVMLECKNSEIRSPQWLKNNAIALLQRYTQRWQLISYTTTDGVSKILHSIEDGDIIFYDYDEKSDLLAVISLQKDNKYYIEVLTSKGKLISKNQIQLPHELERFRHIYPRFSPIEGQLVFSTGRQLHTLLFDGTVTPLNLPLDQSVGSPSFHPNGERALVIKGNYDSDILSYKRTVLSAPLSISKPLVKANRIERSTVADDNAVIQPEGTIIAFVSERSGEEQVWLTGGKKTKQLSQFPLDTYIAGMFWAADGQSLLVNANDKLYQLFLNGQSKAYPVTIPITELLQWQSDLNKVLLFSQVAGLQQLVELDLNNTNLRVVTEKRVNWAKLNENGQLIFTDHLDRFWLQGPIEEQLIKPLTEQGGDNQRFLIKNNVIYGVNDELQLWSYDLVTESFSLLALMPDNMDYLSDINNEQLLIVVHASGKKEVVELLLNK